GIALRAVRQLPGQVVAIEPLLAGQFARLSGRLARLSGVDTLLGDPPSGRGILLEGSPKLVVDDGLGEPPHFAVAELGLCLSLELWFGETYGDHRRQPFAYVVPRDPTLEVLEEPVGLGIRADRARERRAESGEMRASLARVDVVREGKHELLVA